MTLRSEKILRGPDNAEIRALFKSLGYDDYDLKKPLIGVANTWNEIVPGSKNLREVAEYVKNGIFQAGGLPLEFGVISACDGIANGNRGMHYILPSREVIADSIELMVEAHSLDALVLLGSCDKIVPGMLMAAARLKIPSIIVPGGPMEGGMTFQGRAADTTVLVEAMAMLQLGKITEKEYDELENNVAPGCGSCSFLGTANTMCCLAEAMGMSVPGAGTAPAVSAKRLRMAKESGRLIVEMLTKGIRAADIITKEAIENAIKVNMAIGGSTNAVLHILAIAYEAGIDLSIEIFDELSRATPYIAKIYPAGPADLMDFDQAGGIPAVMKMLSPLLKTDLLTVTGKTVAENIQDAEVKNPDIIKTTEDPFNDEGGLAILQGNLAPNTAVTKPASIDSSMYKFTGKARVFESEEDANQAILASEIKEGDIVVIRYEGPKGGPGMREMYKPLKYLHGMGLDLKTALATDGRFSGTNNGCFVGHISPEAYEGGPLAIVEEGDKITIDIPERRLELHVTEDEIKNRLAQWEKPPKKIKSGYLSLYSKLAESANLGGIIKHN